MNQRILQLAVEADEYTKQTVHYYQGQFNGLTWEGKIKQTRDTKFAQLIVRDCKDLLFESSENNRLPIAVDDMVHIIDTHFGVEE